MSTQYNQHNHIHFHYTGALVLYHYSSPLSLSELPEIRLTIACNKMVMQQMYSIALNSTFQVNVIHSIVMIILVLGYTPTSHTHLILHPSFREFVTKTYTQPAGNEVVPKLIR